MLRNIKVGAQIGLVFAVGLALFVLVAIATLVSLRGISDSTNQTDKATGAREAASDVLLQMVNEQTAVRGFAITGDTQYLTLVDLSRLHVQADLPALKQDAETPDEVAAVARVVQTVERVHTFFDAQLALIKAGHRDEAVRHINDEERDFAAMRKAAGALAAYAELRVNDASLAVEDARTDLMQVIVAATVGAMLLFAAMAYLLGRRIGRRLKRVSEAVNDIATIDVNNFAVALGIVADGDLNARFHFDREPLHEDSTDEIGMLAQSYNSLVLAMSDLERAFGETVHRLSGALRGVLLTSQDLDGGSAAMWDGAALSAESVERVSRAFHEVAEGAVEQAERLLAASTAAEELSRTAEQIASGAVDQSNAARAAADSIYVLDEQISALANLGERLHQATNDAIAQAQAGSSAVSRTSDALTALRSVNSNTVTAMTTLEQRTAAVSEILGTIDEIADQTNLLALNAAIEAARAGEHGRGFAVVADEVRKLAERASGATREIGEILNAIRKEAVAAMQALRSSTSRLEEGVSVAATGNEAIARVAGAVRDTANVASEVAERSAMMRRESGAITSNIGSVSAIVEENAAAATEMQRTTTDLSGQLTPVAVAAEEQSRTAEAVSSAALQLSEQMNDIRSFAQHVRDRSGTLRSLANQFSVEAEDGTLEGEERHALTTHA